MYKQLVCRPENVIYQRLDPSKTAKFHPVITFLDLILTFQPFMCLETFQMLYFFQLQAPDTKDEVFILNTVSFKNKQ